MSIVDLPESGVGIEEESTVVNLSIEEEENTGSKKSFKQRLFSCCYYDIE